MAQLRGCIYCGAGVMNGDICENCNDIVKYYRKRGRKPPSREDIKMLQLCIFQEECRNKFRKEQ